MLKKNRKPIGLETLEDRWVPASVRFDGSNLYIYNPSIAGGASSVTVTENTTATTPVFEVTDGTGNVNNGYYNVTGNIWVYGNNAKDTVSVKVNAVSGGLLGNLYVHTGNGASSVTVDSNGAVAGVIYGNVNVWQGLGVGTDKIGNGQGLAINGSVTVSDLSPGASAINFGGGANTATTVGGQTTITGFPEITTGGKTGDMFLGGLTIDNNQNASASTVTMNAADQGNLTLLGGQGATAITFNNNVLGTANLNLGNNTDSISLGKTASILVDNLYVTAGNGGNTFLWTAGAFTETVLGNVSLNLGNGANSFGSSSSLTIDGNFNLDNGNGSLTATSTNGFEASVYGSETVNTGNGANAFEVTEQGSGILGGPFDYTGGNGGNSVTVNNLSNNILKLGVRMGNSPGIGAGGTGDNSFTITSTTTAASLTGSVSWGIPSLEANGNVYNDPGPYVWTNTVTLLNVPS